MNTPLPPRIATLNPTNAQRDPISIVAAAMAKAAPDARPTLRALLDALHDARALVVGTTDRGGRLTAEQTQVMLDLQQTEALTAFLSRWAARLDSHN